MNEKQIDALEGRALDLAIERYVFGRTEPEPINEHGWEQKNDGTWACYYQDCIGGKWQRSYTTLEWPPSYHDSDYLAFKIVDKLLAENQSLLFSCDKLGSDDFWEISIFNYWSLSSIKYCSSCESRPLAICRAALKVCNDQKDN